MVRGFDYYNGLIFEIFDTSPANNRSVFGGGRYDNLTHIFSNENVPAIGFGMGDVTLKDILETYDLLPSFANTTDIYLAPLHENFIEPTMTLADDLRKVGIKVLIDYSSRKVGDQIKSADKQKIPNIICIGENELKSGEFKLKNLNSGEEVVAMEANLAELLK
jgi:histidyl-tRNA synthetase